MGKKKVKQGKAKPAKGRGAKSKHTLPKDNDTKVIANISKTLEEVEAMSSSDEGDVDVSNTSWNAKADALQKLIDTGAYDKMLSKKNEENNIDEEEDEESIEEVILELDNDDDVEEEESEEEGFADKKTKKSNGKANVNNDAKNDRKKASDSDSQSGSDSDSEEESDENDKKRNAAILENEEEDGEKSDKKGDNESDENSGSESENDDGEEEDEDGPISSVNDINSKALLAKTEELISEKKQWPWVETFAVTPTAKLPFGTREESTGLKIDIHDDLKREVAFYDVALEAVEIARKKCKAAGVPFSRPDDFFAEMVKSDDHMARVKDRLIFENKKIEAVAQRKSNREQKLRSKEAHANKIAEKSRRKKENMKAVDDWAHAAAANRGGRYGDSDADQAYLKRFTGGGSGGGQRRGWTDRDGNLQTGPNKKRLAANRKYGHGGKRGRFKQNDPRDLNDMSKFNPRGSGIGAKKGHGGSGANRKGKRARDAFRARSS